MTAAISNFSVLAFQPFSFLHITHFEAQRYFVQSRSNGGIPYLVDMEEYGGNGWCGCPGFLHYIEALELGAAPSPALQCRHIRAVREYLITHPKPVAS